jgi:hypothetical protein
MRYVPVEFILAEEFTVPKKDRLDVRWYEKDVSVPNLARC